MMVWSWLQPLVESGLSQLQALLCFCGGVNVCVRVCKHEELILVFHRWLLSLKNKMYTEEEKNPSLVFHTNICFC